MPLDGAELDTIAARMLADYDAVNPGSVFAEGFRPDLADAWRIQTAITTLREARGEQVIGYKTGAQSPSNREMMGLPQPVWGRLWASERHHDGAALKKSDYANIAIEAEFGITVSHDLEPGLSSREIADAVEAVYPLLELHNLIFRGEPPHGSELVANNCINCGVVLGAPVKDLSTARETDLQLVYDGTVVDEWSNLRWPHDIIASIDWLTGTLATSGLRVKAGDLILTGAWGPPIPVGAHTRVDVISSAFGNVSATFA